MEASRILPEGEPEVPQITLLRDMLPDGKNVYHFYVDGQESSVTLTREEAEMDQHVETYKFNFYGWQFGEADVYHSEEGAAVEWLGIIEDLEGLAAIQARKLMGESTGFLYSAIEVDFPGLINTEDTAGNL